MTPAGLRGIASRTRSELRYPVEFCWLLGLVFFLPMFEAPKNICWLAYVLTWLYNRARAREWGGRWNAWDSLFAVWIASGYLVAAFAGIHHDEWSAANDIFRYGSVVWLTARSRYGERTLLVILGTAIASTLLTLAWACWELVAKTKIYLELNSVGYYNHSAIYLAIVFGIALSLALAYGSRVSMTGRILLHSIALVLAVSVFLTGSRGGVATAVLLALTYVSVFAARTGRSVIKALVCVIAGTALLLAAVPSTLKRTEAQAEAGVALSYRDQIWSIGLIEWRQFPLFGVGMGNFGRRSWEDLQAWNKGHSWAIRPSAEPLALNAPHGHSLYINTLAERGLFGLAVLALVLFAWGKFLLVSVPAAASSAIEWAVFGSAFSGWFVSVTAGLVNTTLHHEHGILATLLLGLWLGLHRTGATDRSPPLR
jgi:O-antigen ligase